MQLELPIIPSLSSEVNMKTDRFELQVSTDKQSVIDALNHFSTQLLQNGQGAGEILDAVKIDPDDLLLNCHSGILFLYTHDDADTVSGMDFLLYGIKR